MPASPSASGGDPFHCYVEAVQTLGQHDWAVIDMDTGTVLGTNIVLVPFPHSDEEWCDAIISSYSDALAYAQQHGITLYRLDR